MGVVSLPMYDWPEVRSATDAFYDGLRTHLSQAGFDAPDALNRPGDLSTEWQSPDLLLSQTCGLPYVRTLRDTVSLLGTPVYDLPGCRAGEYASALVVRASDSAKAISDLEGARAIVNGFDSQSGCAALFQAVLARGFAPPFFAETEVSGSHRASAAAVADGQADVCAIDPVSWQLIQDWDAPVARRLRILGWGNYGPALPLVTAKAIDADRLGALRAAVCGAFADPMLESERRALYLRGLEPLEDRAYDTVSARWHALQASGFLPGMPG